SKMKKLYLLMFIGVLLLPVGCKKEPKPIPGVTSFPQELKDLFYFQPGTWWIYEDSISGILDTITVESLDIDTLTYYDAVDNIDGIYEVFELVSYSTHYKYFYKYKFQVSVLRQFHLDNFDIHKTRPGNYDG